MTLFSFNLVVLIVSLSILVAQLLVRKKHTSHIIFAVFCGSVSMILLQAMSGDSIGGYKYLIGLGAIATCNCYWLLSRSLFRSKDAIASHHLAFALAISLLILIKQAYLFASSIELIAASTDSFARHVLSEFTILLSSCVLVLSFWEGCRGYQRANRSEKAQRILFLTTFGSAVLISKISAGAINGEPLANQWVASSLILLVLVSTQVLMVWRYGLQKQPHTQDKDKPVLGAQLLDSHAACELEILNPCLEQQLAAKIKKLLIERQLFLQECPVLK